MAWLRDAPGAKFIMLSPNCFMRYSVRSKGRDDLSSRMTVLIVLGHLPCALSTYSMTAVVTVLVL